MATFIYCAPSYEVCQPVTVELAWDRAPWWERRGKMASEANRRRDYGGKGPCRHFPTSIVFPHCLLAVFSPLLAKMERLYTR